MFIPAAGSVFYIHRAARIAQSVEHQTFNLRVQGSSPCLGGNCFCNSSLLNGVLSGITVSPTLSEVIT